MTGDGPHAAPASGVAGADPARVAELLDIAPCALLEVRRRPDGGEEITYLNRAATEMYGYTADEAVGRDVAILRAADVEDVERRRDALDRTGRWRGTTRHKTKAGRLLDVELRVTTFRDAAGGVERYLIAVSDITEETERMRRVAEQSALLQLAPDPIMVLDLEGRITFWNRAAETTYGYTAEEAVGRQVRDLVQSEYPLTQAQLRSVVDEQGNWAGDVVQTTSNGRRFNMASNWGALRDEDGRLIGLLEVNRDASDRISLETERERESAQAERDRLSRRLVRAQRLESLGQLAGGIAHDFNNLLAVIAGYATMLSAGLDDADSTLPRTALEGLLEDVSEIARATRRAGDLTHQLLAFARQESVHGEPVSLNDVIADVREMLGRMVGDGVTLELQLDPALCCTLGDAGQLGQILVNLAVNARDAMPDGGRLIIETANVTLDDQDAREREEITPGRYAQLRVTDTGTGMPAEVLEHAFDPFYTTKGSVAGTGLGLATVYGIVVQAGGRATLYSEVGRGTTFQAIFPAADEAPAAAAPQTEPVDAGAGDQDRATVLVVEDQGPLRAVTARILERGGYRVLTAASGPEALELAAGTSGSIDVLLTDVMMPEMLGQQLAEHLRERRPDIRVIFTSGFARRALEQGGRPLDGPLLQKPISAAELLARVADALEGE